MKRNSFVRVFAALLCFLMVAGFVPTNLLTVYAGGTAAPAEALWDQVGDIDKTTGANWWSVGGYGDEQAVLLGISNANGGSNGNNWVDASTSWGSVLNANLVGGQWNGSGAGVYYTNTADDKISITNDAPGGLSVIPAGSIANGKPVELAYLEAPANPTSGYTSNLPHFNTITNWPEVPAAGGAGFMNATTYPIAEGLNRREAISFTVPEAKANNEYLFTVHLNTQPTVTDPNADLDLYVVAADGTVGNKVRLNTVADIGDTGAYITFKVKGSFTVVMDTAESLNQVFGYSAFFFDPVENTAPEFPAEKLWKQYGETDKTTGAAWHSVGGYGDEQAVLLGISNANGGSNGNNWVDASTSWGSVLNANLVGGQWNGNGAGVYYTNTADDKISITNDAPGGLSVIPAGSIANGKPVELAYLEAPANPSAGYTSNPPHFNTITNWPEVPAAGGAGFMNATTYPIAEGLNRREAISFTVPESKANNAYLFTVHLNTQPTVTDPNADLDLYVVAADGTVSEKVRLNTVTDIGDTGAYITFAVKGSFTVVMDTAESLNQVFGYSAFFFDEAPVDDGEDDEGDTPTQPAEGLWSQFGATDKTTGAAWWSVGKYGDEQAILLGINNARGGFNGNNYVGAAAGSWGAVANANLVGGKWNGNGTGAYYTNEDANAIKLADGYGNGGMSIIPTSEETEAYLNFGQIPKALAYLEAPENPGDAYLNCLPHFNTITNWPDTPAAGSAGVLNSTNYPLDEGMTYREAISFTVPESKAQKEYYFTVHLNTQPTVTDPNADLYLYLVAADGTVGEKVKLNTLTDIGDTGAYITFKVKGSFTVVMDTPGSLHNVFGYSAFFFDEEAPEQTIEDVILVDKTTGAAWHSVGGYGDEQAVLLGISNTNGGFNGNNYVGAAAGSWGAVANGALVGGKWNGNGTGAYYTNEDANAIKLADGYGNGGMSIIPTSEETEAYLNFGQIPKALAYLEAPANPTAGYQNCLPHFNTITNWPQAVEENSANGEYYTPTYPLEEGMAYREVMEFTVPTANAEKGIYFTVHLNTQPTVAAPDGDVYLYVVDAEGNVSEKVKLNAAADIGKTGVYVTFVVRGDFAVILDTPSSMHNLFGYSAFFFDKDEAPVNGEEYGESEPPVDPGPVDPPTVPQIDDVVLVDKTTGGAWWSEGGYGDLQAVLLGFRNSNGAFNGNNYAGAVPGTWGSFANSLLVGGKYNENGHQGGVYYTDTNEGTMISLKDDNVGELYTVPTSVETAPYSVFGEISKELAYLEAPKNPSAGYLSSTPHFNTITALPVEVTDNGNGYFNAINYPLGDGMTYREVMEFTVPTAEAEKGIYFTVHLNTQPTVTDPNADLYLYVVAEDGTVSQKVKLNTKDDIGKTGAYVTFVVRGNFTVFMDTPATLYNIFGFSAFFFDRDEQPVNGETYVPPVTPGGPTNQVDNRPDMDTTTYWSQVGILDVTTGSYWRSKTGYGSEQAILLGMSNAITGNDGNVLLSGEYATTTGKTEYVGGKYNSAGANCGVYYTNNSGTGIKIQADPATGKADYGALFLVPTTSKTEVVNGVTVATLPTYLEAPLNPDPGYGDPRYNVITAWPRNVTADSEFGEFYDANKYPLETGVTQRRTMSFNIPAAKENEDFYFTVHLNTRATVDDPGSNIYLYVVSADGTVGQKVKVNAATIGKTGMYITFAVKGDFTVFMDTPSTMWNKFGYTAFFFDDDKPEPEAGSAEKPYSEGTWQQSGNIDMNTGGRWQDAGYGTVQAILPGWSQNVVDLNNAEVAKLDDVTYHTHIYTHYQRNPQDASWSKYTGEDAIRLVDNPEWSNKMYGMYEMFQARDIYGEITNSVRLQTPDGYEGNIPIYNTYTAIGWDKSDANCPFTDTAPLSSDLDRRVALRFAVPDEDTEYAFTLYADTLNYKYKVDDPVEFVFLSKDGSQVLGRTRVTGADFGKRGGYITFKVRGTFILCIDRLKSEQEDKSTSTWFGVSGFFFDEYEGDKYHYPNDGTKDKVHLGNMVDTIGGMWKGRYGKIDAILMGYGTQTKFSSWINFEYPADSTYSTTNTLKWGFEGDRIFIWPSKVSTTLYNPNEMEDFEYRAMQSQGSTAVGLGMLPLEEGYTRSISSFHGLEDGKPYLFTVYSDNSASYSTYDKNIPTKIKMTFLDAEGDIIFQETISSTEFNKGAYRSYVVTCGFTLIIDKSDAPNYFGFSGYFFDEVTENFVTGLSAQAGEEDRSVLLTWEENDPATGSTVVLERKEEGGSWVEIAELRTGIKQYLDTKRTSNTKYYYRMYTRRAVSASYITETVSYTVPAYTKTVMTLDKTSYTSKSNEESFDVTLTLTTADGKPCVGVPVFVKLDFGHSQQVVPMVHEPQVLTDSEGKATITVEPRYLGEVTVTGFNRDNDEQHLSWSFSEPSDGYIGELNWATAPSIFKLSDAVSPGDLININGYGLRNDDMSKLKIMAAPHTGEPAQTPSDNAIALAPVQVDEEYGYYVVTRLPEDAEAGLYDVWVNNGYGWSEPVVLNAPRPLFISEYEAWEGQTLLMSGRDLKGQQFGMEATTLVRLTNDYHTEMVEVTRLTPYSLDFKIPEGTPHMEYEIQVSNDGGTTWADLSSGQKLQIVEVGNDPFNTGLAWMDHFNWDDTYNVTDFGADGTDKKGDTVAFAAAIRTAKENGGGTVYIPNGTYYITTLQVPSYVVLIGEDSENTVLTYCGRNRYVNMFQGNSETRDEGHIGFANFKITLENDAFRPDSFFWLGHEWNEPYVSYGERRTASEFFLIGIHIEYGQTIMTGPRGFGSVIVGDERFLLQDNYSNAYEAFIMTSKQNQYAIYRNNTSIFEGGLFNTNAKYCFIYENYMAGHFGEREDWEYNRMATHGICAQAQAHMENNVVENVGTSATAGLGSGENNDGETYLLESQFYLPWGYVLASTADTVTVKVANTSLFNDDITASYAWSGIQIVDGRGMGQIRKIVAINAATGVITIDRPWDVNPDTTSVFTYTQPCDESTIYNNVDRNCAKGVYLFGDCNDVVVANHTGEDTEGVLIFGTHSGQGKSRIYANYYNVIRDSSFTGVSARSKVCCVGLTTSRESSEGAYVGIQNYATEIRNNVIHGDLTKIGVYKDALGRQMCTTEQVTSNGVSLATGSTQMLEENGIGDNTNTIIEDNKFIDIRTAINYTGWDRGIVVEDNIYENVDKVLNDHFESFDGGKNADYNMTIDSITMTDLPTDADSVTELLAKLGSVDTSGYCAASVETMQQAMQTAQALPADASEDQLYEARRAMRLSYGALENHHWNDGEVTKEATELQLGEETFTCTECGAVKLETAPKLVAKTNSLWIVILIVCCAAVVVIAAVTVIKAKKKVKTGKDAK